MKVTESQIKTCPITGNLYFTAKVNGNYYIGSVYLIGGINAVSYARNVNCNKRTTLRIMLAIENSLNK